MYTCMHNWSKSLLLGNSAFGATSIHLCSLYIHVWITQPNSPFINHNQADNQRIADRKKLGYLLVLRSGDVGPWNFYLHREKNTHTHKWTVSSVTACCLHSTGHKLEHCWPCNVSIPTNPNSKHRFTTSFFGGRCRKAMLGVCHWSCVSDSYSEINNTQKG